MELVFPDIETKSGNIKSMYLESYNRDLTTEDIDSIIKLIEQNKLQQVVDEYFVRKIFVPGKKINPQLLEKAALTGNSIFF